MTDNINQRGGLPQGAVQTAADPHLFLIGRPPVTEFLGYIRAQTIEGRTRAQGDLMDAWRAANDHIRELEVSEKGFADDVAIGDLSPELKPLGENVVTDPIAQRTYALAPIQIAMVELDRLVIFQKQINLAYAGELRVLAETASSECDIFRLAIPQEQRHDPQVQVGQTADNSWIFKSLSNDFRLLDAEILDPSQVPGLNATGVPTAVLAVTVGYGANYLSALRVEGRLVLNNGSHRAFALRDAGHTHVPCLVQDVSRREELEALVGLGHPLAMKPDDYLTAPRPPLFKDYFDERLRMTVDVPRTVRQVQLSFGYAPADLPG